MGVKIINKPTLLESFIAKVRKSKNRAKLEVGFFPRSKYITGEFVAQVAYDNEYGTNIIPQRPFFKRANNMMRKEYPNLFRKSFKDKVLTLQQLELIGVEYKNHIQRSIKGEFGEFQPNAPETIKSKGSDKPLLDTGTMLQSVSFKISYGN